MCIKINKVGGWILQELAGDKINTLQEMRLRDIPVEVYREHREFVPGRFGRRVVHFFSEVDRVQKGVKAWEEGDIDTFGKLMFQSGESSVYQYECGCPELITIFEILKKCEGVYGARFSGAGYATRLYPLTKDKPKPLLEVAGKSILAHILEKVEKINPIEEVIIITNQKFYPHFSEWVEQYHYSKKIQVMDDGTTTNENRLGAIADIQYVIDHHSHMNDELMVLAGDNLFDFELSDFVEFYQKVSSDCITTHEINAIQRIKRTGVIEVNQEGKVISFEEKPQKPKSNLAVPPFYIYQKETIPLIKQYLTEGNNADAPGNFIPWLIQHKDVYAYKFEGKRYDIGTLESYEKVQEIYRGRRG